MKIISNFTQTYRGTPEWTPGSDCRNRDFLIDSFCRNVNKIKCYNMLDYPTFSFHNFDIEGATRLNNKIKEFVPNIKSYCYNDTTFGTSILTHLTTLKNKGITDIMWIQDDEFFTHSNFEDFTNFLEFYKKTDDIKNVSLLYPRKEFDILESLDVRKIPNTNLEISCFYPQELKKVRPYSMDFTAFICNLEYFLTKMFDESFCNIRDAYQLEGAVLHKSAANNIERRFLNVNFFESFNIVGMGGSISQGNERYQRLKQLNLI